MRRTRARRSLSSRPRRARNPGGNTRVFVYAPSKCDHTIAFWFHYATDKAAMAAIKPVTEMGRSAARAAKMVVDGKNRGAVLSPKGATIVGRKGTKTEPKVRLRFAADHEDKIKMVYNAMLETLGAEGYEVEFGKASDREHKGAVKGAKVCGKRQSKAAKAKAAKAEQFRDRMVKAAAKKAPKRAPKKAAAKKPAGRKANPPAPRTDGVYVSGTSVVRVQGGRVVWRKTYRTALSAERGAKMVSLRASMERRANKGRKPAKRRTAKRPVKRARKANMGRKPARKAVRRAVRRY